jgi:integrase
MGNKHYSFRVDATKGKIYKDGSSPITLVIRKDGQRKKLYLGISANIIEVKRKDGTTEVKSQWNDKYQRYEVDGRKELHPDRVALNKWLDELSGRCDDIIKDFEKNKIDWTLNQFEQKYLNKSKKTGVEAYFNRHIDRLKQSGHIGNMNCYSQCLHMLKLSDSKFGKLLFNDIDRKYIDKFHTYLYNERECSQNTIRYYMKAFRALINKAIKDGEASNVTYPFGKDGYSILGEETGKRYLTSADLDKLKNKPLEDFHLNLYRNIFLFSYYCQGMAFVDVAHLKKSNIVKMESGNYIVYKRQKTEGKNAKAISIKITDQIQTLLDWFKANTPLITDYLVPCITMEGYEGEKLYQHIKDRVHRFNKNLKTIATKLEISGITLTTYVSRHSYAMRLQNSGISREVISQALGHKDLNTTNTYLDSFGNEVIDKANEVL